MGIPKGVWHKLESLESGSVVFECKEGPFVEHEVEGGAGGFVRIVFRRAVAKITEKVDDSNLDGKELARSWQRVRRGLQVLKNIADFCVEAHSLAEIAKHLGLGDRYKMKKKYIDPILGKYIEMTIPEAPNSKLQKYILTDAGRELSKIKL